jgi:hypothetical protein
MVWNASSKPYRDALIAELSRKDWDSLRRIARAQISKAAQGDTVAAKEIADRIDGRVPSIVSGDKENPLTYQRIERVIVQVEDRRALTLEHQSSTQHTCDIEDKEKLDQ